MHEDCFILLTIDSVMTSFWWTSTLGHMQVASQEKKFSVLGVFVDVGL